MSNFTLLLTVQHIAACITLVGTLLVVAVVVFLIATSSKEEDKDSAKRKVYAARRPYFWGLILVLAVLLFSSLRFIPYDKFKGQVDETYTVVARQWSWAMAQGQSDEPAESFIGTNEITVPANKHIRFIVTAVDVNHNFAVYNSKGEIVAQVQAMPQYSRQRI